MISYDKVSKFFDSNDYVSSELLKYYTLRGINLINESTVGNGQDIYAICLDGPPGAGKSLYAKLYAQMVSELLKVKVELISYQCDDSTSKIELFEDINVGAAVAGKEEKVNIPGVIARSILAVNKGKKVILFIDEYDKSREQVDSLFLQFLQDGRINTNQFGDLAIKDEYKGNIQVIFCKNDFRTELTGPLTRRIRKVELKIIKPHDFMSLAIKKYVNKNNKDTLMPIIELVSLVYESVYDKEDYTRLPATSEMYGAIEDILFLNQVNAPSHIVYTVLIEDLFKNEDDRELFKSTVDEIDNNILKNILITLRETNEENSIKTISEMIIDSFRLEASKLLEQDKNNLLEQQNKLKEKEKQLEGEYKLKEKKLDEKLKELDEYTSKIKKEFDSLVTKKKQMVEDNKAPMGQLYAKNFEYSSPLVKRGENVFISDIEWEECATINIKNNRFDNSILMEHMVKEGNIVYENGYLKTIILENNKGNENVNLALVRDKVDGDYLNFRVFIDKKYLNNENKDEYIKELFYYIVTINDNSEYDMKVNGNSQKLNISSANYKKIDKSLKLVKEFIK